MGVRGAALANTLATSAAFLGLLTAFLAGLGSGRTAGPRLALSELGRLLRFGIPSGLNWFFEFAAFSFFVNVVVAGLGTSVIAAWMAVMQITSISFMPAFGVASAGAILVGQSIGAGRLDEVPGIVRTGILTNATWQSVVALSYLVLAGPIMRPFVAQRTDGAEFQKIGTYLLALSSIWQLFDGAASCLAEALRAAGDTAFTLWARVVIAWLIFVPVSLLSVRWLHGGELWSILSLALYLGLLGATLLVRFRGGAWRRIDLTGKQAMAA
jgi:MATE family multidrug resistance protein